MAVLIYPGVVAGGDSICAQLAGGIKEMFELDFTVAQHIRVGRAAGRVFGKKMLEHAFPIFV